MSQAKKGDTVKVHYKGTLEDGTVFDNSEGRDPISFVLGEPGIIPGFQEVVEGMAPGETKKETFGADKAYGPRQENLVLEVPRQEMPKGLEPKKGMQLSMSRPDGATMVVQVAGVSEEKVTLDANHPLAGKDLTFEITLVAVGS